MRAGTSAGAVGIARYLRASVRLKYPSERYRFLIYLTGYLDGKQGATTWDERLTGERIERARAACKSTPAASVLRVFTEAWSR